MKTWEIKVDGFTPPARGGNDNAAPSFSALRSCTAGRYTPVSTAAVEGLPGQSRTLAQADHSAQTFMILYEATPRRLEFKVNGAPKSFRLTKKEPSSAGRPAACSAPIRISKDDLCGPSFCIINSD